MKKIASLLCLLILATGMITAQQNRNKSLVNIRIIPTSGSWDYKVNEPIKMDVSVEKDELPIGNISISYDFGPEMMTPTKKGEVTIKNKSVVIDCGKLTTPGFLTLNVKVRVDGQEYTQWKTVGVERDKILPTVKLPADFNAFWDAQIKQLAAIPMKAQMTLMPEQCTDRVNVYHISYQCTTAGGRFFGILCVPKAPGKYPAILRVPGAGIRPYTGEISLAERGYITLVVGIHGIPVNQDKEIYNMLSKGGMGRYSSMNMENRETYYYNRVYKGCKRAIDFIYTLPEFDEKNVAVIGGSQGGALAVVVAALDTRVTCATSDYPALSDMTGYLYNRAGGWPHMLRYPEESDFNTKECIETLSYYDVVNFAKQVKCPIRFSMGYNDKVCPPTTTFSVYNVVTAPKELQVVYETGHWVFAEQDTNTEKFVKTYLKQ